MSRTKWMNSFAVRFFGLITLSASALAQSPESQTLSPHDKLLREIYQELVEINTIEATAPPLTSDWMKAVESITADMWPGVPVIPTMATGGIDGRFLNNVGIWTYGVSGIFTPPEGSKALGLDEKLPVKSLYEGHEFLWRLGKRLVVR